MWPGLHRWQPVDCDPQCILLLEFLKNNKSKYIQINVTYINSNSIIRAMYQFTISPTFHHHLLCISCSIMGRKSNYSRRASNTRLSFYRNHLYSFTHGTQHLQDQEHIKQLKKKKNPNISVRCMTLAKYHILLNNLRMIKNKTN